MLSAVEEALREFVDSPNNNIRQFLNVHCDMSFTSYYTVCKLAQNLKRILSKRVVYSNSFMVVYCCIVYFIGITEIAVADISFLLLPMLRMHGATPHHPHTSLCYKELALSITTGLLNLT
jgi:hypothetical protein